MNGNESAGILLIQISGMRVKSYYQYSDGIGLARLETKP
jgi:hypothetical protein